ncbi:hypothetical protein [Paradevosia shaoguanensis]|uniref:hypothetical protein n=1 Tax=Paradevosia shaoguanensis TaxID=1335043 RepID=UPI003C7600A0
MSAPYTPEQIQAIDEAIGEFNGSIMYADRSEILIEITDAARRWLEFFTTHPDGPFRPVIKRADEVAKLGGQMRDIADQLSTLPPHLLGVRETDLSSLVAQLRRVARRAELTTRKDAAALHFTVGMNWRVTYRNFFFGEVFQIWEFLGRAEGRGRRDTKAFRAFLLAVANPLAERCGFEKLVADSEIIREFFRSDHMRLFKGRGRGDFRLS